MLIEDSCRLPNLRGFCSVDRQEQHDLRILGRAIRSVRERRGLTAEELAAASGIALERIAAVEGGRLDPGFDLLITLARAMDVPLSAFFGRVEELARDDAGGHAGR
jgi:transcriptional regulator with XRE-family HTH domain